MHRNFFDMKKTIALVLCVFAFSCGQGAKEKLVGNYGELISTSGAISTTDMIAKLGEQDSMLVKVKSEIVTTCSMKGCWMNLVLADGEEMRVTFKDYGFFVPKEGMTGNIAVIEGTVKRELTDVETLRHFAEDAGKSEMEIAGITEAKEELTFVATGVVILEAEGEE